MYIVITLPEFIAGEADAIVRLFQSGLERLHLRKPESTEAEYRDLLRQIPSCYHSRIVLHDHFSLLDEFSLCGVHLNRRNPVAPEGWTGHVSCSCHSLEEVRQRKPLCDYVSLSPIYDSISKEGYSSAFSRDELLAAREAGVIDGKVMALGGITTDRLEEVETLGFGGVMVLGDAWKRKELPIVLTIAGSDPSAGAGIQQDLKTITQCGCYGATVITAVTSQNTYGVQGIMPMPPEIVESQLNSVFDDLSVDAVKIGMIPNEQVAEAIISVLSRRLSLRPIPVVCDPVMVSTSGRRLMDVHCVETVFQRLFPLCTLVTPNLPESELLATYGEIPSSTLVKGGHAEGLVMTDTLRLFHEKREESFSSPRINTPNLHGTGCTLSSAIASYMAHGATLSQAVRKAKAYMDDAIQGGRSIRIGHGNGPLWKIQVN